MEFFPGSIPGLKNVRRSAAGENLAVTVGTSCLVPMQLLRAAERVMVCLSSRSPHAGALLRKAARIADRLGAPWYAVYVQTPREAPEYVDAATQRQIGNSLELARQLGTVAASRSRHRRYRRGQQHGTVRLKGVV